MEFELEEYIMVPNRPKWVPSETTRKLWDCSTRPFKVVKQVIPNAYVIDVSSYKGLAVILDDLFYEPSHDLIVNLIPNPAPINLPSKCKEHIDTILDEQIIFTRDRSSTLQSLLLRWKRWPNLDCSWITGEEP